MVLGEAPGEVEDQRGLPWQGRTGSMLRRKLEFLGVSLFEDCINLNAVACRPISKNGTNATPTEFQMDCCRVNVIDAIEHYKPKVIIPLGESAIYSLIGHLLQKELGKISKWRGWTIPDQNYMSWICPTFHPSYIERLEKGPEEKVWELDLTQAFNQVEIPFPKFVKPEIQEISDLYMLTNIRNDVAIDYETTGIKPHAKGHRIVCAAVAPSENLAYVFMMPSTKRERQPLIDLLIDSKIGKMAHNMKFEHTWTQFRLFTEIENWIWDSMVSAHILDNRQQITGLKFQAYINFGVIDYSSDVSPYLQSVDKKNGNSFNRIFELLEIPGGRQKLLKYCGWDAVLEYRLATKQRENILPF